MSRTTGQAPEENDLTSFHVRRARDGEQESLGWLVARFSPLLALQAGYRLRGSLRGLYDPEDLVNEVWVVALPRLGGLHERGGRLTPVLLKFLSTVLLQRTNKLITKHLQRSGNASAASFAEHLPAEITSPSTEAARDETLEALRAALSSLDEGDREVLVLRGIEQVSNNETARLLGVTPGAVTQRYQRALTNLRQRLPGGIFDELPEG